MSFTNVLFLDTIYQFFIHKSDLSLPRKRRKLQQRCTFKKNGNVAVKLSDRLFLVSILPKNRL